MPTRAHSICTYPGCRVSTRERRCPLHAGLSLRERRPDHRPSAVRRGYDHRWRELRARKLAANPWCEAPGCRQAACEVDHIVPKTQGGTDEWHNLQALCRSHHSAKTMRQSVNPLRRLRQSGGVP